MWGALVSLVLQIVGMLLGLGKPSPQEKLGQKEQQADTAAIVIKAQQNMAQANSDAPTDKQGVVDSLEKGKF
jgi:hypothetical protein